jgi:hypothetical protein
MLHWRNVESSQLSISVSRLEMKYLLFPFLDYLQDLIVKTVELLALYTKKGVSLPATLKENLGEFIIFSELDSQKNVVFKDATNPGFD